MLPASFARRRRVLIAGAAGRDFHNFNVVYRDDSSVEVVAFTAARSPGSLGGFIHRRLRAHFIRAASR
jgi:predicted GTPase